MRYVVKNRQIYKKSQNEKIAPNSPQKSLLQGENPKMETLIDGVIPALTLGAFV